MSSNAKRMTRRIMMVALVGGLMTSMMYVSYAMGFRSGIREDTVWLMPNC
ncbi:MAG: hypothetical protein RIC29_11180 [Rhodospirillaceae bacterium]